MRQKPCRIYMYNSVGWYMQSFYIYIKQQFSNEMPPCFPNEKECSCRMSIEHRRQLDSSHIRVFHFVSQNGCILLKQNFHVINKKNLPRKYYPPQWSGRIVFHRDGRRKSRRATVRTTFHQMHNDRLLGDVAVLGTLGLQHFVQ